MPEDTIESGTEKVGIGKTESENGGSKSGKNKNKNIGKNDLCGLALPIVVTAHFVVTVMLLLTCVFSGETDAYGTFLSVLCLVPLLAAELLLNIKYQAICILNTVLFSLIYYLNEYVIAARGKPISYIDIFCISDAWKVRGRYSLIMNGSIIGVIAAACVILAAALVIIHFLSKGVKIRYAAKAGFAVFYSVILAVCVFSGGLLPEKPGWNEMLYYTSNGLPCSILSGYLASKVSEPEGYSPEKADEILSAYSGAETSDAEMPVNVIVIMNEALADYSLIGEPDFTEDPLPFIHSLDNNCVKGSMTVNSIGCGTCNTEFEFLTGNALYFLPSGTMPYVTFNLVGCESMASYMKGLGYHTTAVHPYYASEYKRSQVYPALGFDDFIPGESFSEQEGKAESGGDLFGDLTNGDFVDFGSDLEYIRGFVSDAECFRKITETVKKDNAEGRNSFVFSVTIQNHSGYDLPNFDYDGMTDYTDGKARADTEQYLNLCRITDDAFRELVTEFENCPERTVILMFGDHQPALTFDCYRSKPESANEWQEKSRDYIVPYIMWANYDADWEQNDIISANYLSAVLKKGCGLPLTEFDGLRLEAKKTAPVLTWNFCVDANGSFTEPSGVSGNEVIQDYELAEYKRIFDNDK